MKKFFSLAMVVLLSISSAFATTVYCKMTQSWWTADGAAVGVHYWGGASSTTWPGVRMTEVKGETGMWSYDVPSDATGIIFTRVNGSGDIADWGAKTGDLTLPTDGKNLYTITSASAVWGDPGCTGEWSKYVVPTVTYTVTSTKAVSTTGTAPEGSAAVYSSTYGTKCQLTKDNSMTLTLSGYEGNKITGITLSMKSNKAGGAGKLVVKAGKDTLVYIADAAFNTKSWNGAYTTEYVNITPTMVKDDYAIQKDEDVVITIEATANSLYCQSFALVYEKAGSTPEPPTPEAKYYLTGDSAFVVDAGLTKDKAWDPAAIAVDADVYKLNLKADVAYKLKVTVDGKWSTAKGHSALSGTVPAGVTADTDDNICFTLSEAGEVVVTYNATAFTIAGKFKTSGGGGSTTAYYMKNNWNGATDWTWKAMEQDGANYKLSNVVFGGTGVNYNTEEVDATAQWVAIDAIAGDKIGALDTVDLVLDPAAKTVTATLLGKYNGGSGGGSTTAYYMKNNWNGVTDWTWKAMEQDGANYKLSNVVFGGTGVNYNTAQDDATAQWVAIDAIAGDKIAALDTVDLVLDPAAKTVTATLLGKYDAGGGSGGGSTEAKYYITGDSALVVDAGLTKDKAWDPAAIAVDADVYKLNLKADVAYKLKVTVDGKWSTAKGHSALSGTVPAGVTADTDDNICFTLSEAGEVVVTYNATAFTIDGKFKTSGGGGSTTAYYMKNNWNGATDWTWKAMEQDGANYKLSNVVFGGTGVNYNTAESDEGSTWVPAEAILGAKIGALDTVDLVLDPVAKSVTATLIGKYEIPSDAKYYMKNNWNGATDWTWKEMTKDGATYKLENVVFGGTGVNFNTKEDDSGATWVAVDAILGDKIAALDTVTLVLKPGDAEVTATLLGKYVAPVTPGEVKYYILGDGDLMGNWIMDNAIAVEADSYTFKSMPKGTYAFKVLSAKDWTQPNYGYSNLTGTIPAGVKAGDQNNIMFTIAEPNDVTITFKATGTTVETFTITGVFSTEAPKGFYITGNAALMGADKAWTPAQAIYEEGTTYTFKLLPAGIYQMKVLMTNTGWAGAMGYNELTTKPEGVTGDGDNNINFVLTETGDVKVTYVAGTTFTVEGNFYVVPTTPQYGLLIDGTTFVEATINPGNDQELMATNVSLTAGQTFVLYDNVNKIGWAAAIWKDDTSYKFQIENEAYKVTETGVYDFYLHVEMGADWLYVSKQGTSGLDNINGNNELRKVIENGVMYIYRDGHKYSVQGLLMY